MEGLSASTPLWPLAVYTLVVFGIVSIMVILSFFLGERHSGRSTNEPYESGAVPVGSATRTIDVRYYLIAVFFVIFDLEAIFIFSWAIAIRELGWSGYVEVVIFILFLLTGLIYLWFTGALEASTRRQALDKTCLH